VRTPGLAEQVTESAASGHSTTVTPVFLAGALPPGQTSADAPPEPAVRFDDVYENHVDFVWRSLRRLGVADAGVEDAVQDVFVVVHRRLAEFEGRSTMKTWIFGILYRVASDHRRLVRRKGDHEPLSPAIADARPLPDAVLEVGDALRSLDAALARIDPLRRAVLVMSDIEGLTAPEIAEALSIKPNTVYSRLRVARQELELALGPVREEEA
jgi:RNA polymerase sigma-70 factor (ECF subfamily)